MTTPTFSSSLAQAIAALVTFKRLEGYDYTAQAMSLHYFDAFLVRQEYQHTSLSRQIVEAYIASTAHLAPNTRYSRLSVTRVLSRHLHQDDPANYVLHELPVERPSLPRWYQYSPNDISCLLQHTRSLGPAQSLRPHCMHLLVGLLFVTGLRIAEALALNLGDVDITRGLILVRKGKFGKARYVVMDTSTIRVVKQYLCTSAAHGPTTGSSPLFLTASGNRLGYKLAANTFRHIIKTCGIGRDARRPPRLHDARHTYACNCVLKWYEEGADVNAKLPILATAMGHVNAASSRIYLHVTSRLLDQATERFRATFTANCKGD